MTTSYDIGSMFLRDIGAPDTQGMRRAVAIWLRFETGSTVIGNNPWNLHSGAPCDAARKYCPGQGSLPGQIGNRYAGTGDRNVAVFGTLDAGVKASASNIMRQGYGYPAVVRAAKAGDAIGFLAAVQSSSWSAGHYGYSKLVSAAASSLAYNFDVTLRSVSGDQTQQGGNPSLQEFQALLDKLGIPSDPTYVLTEADAKKLADQYGVTGDIYDRIVQKFTGKTVLEASGGGAVPNTIDDVVGIAKGIGDVFAFLFDAQNWVLLFALLGGIVLAGIGGKMLIDATGQQLPTLTTQGSAA